MKKTKGQARLAMLANHGFEVGGFATIGEWDRFERSERGMVWGGRIGHSTPPADQARTLLEQKLLNQLSVGWVPVQRRFVTLKDADLDPHIKQAMEDAGVDEVYAYLDWYPVEGSIVDVGDDPGARIAAQLHTELKADLVEEIKKTIEGSGFGVQGSEGGFAELAKQLQESNRTLFEGALHDFRNQAIEALEALVVDPEADYAAALLDEDADASSCDHSERGDPDARQDKAESAGTGELLERLRQIQ